MKKVTELDRIALVRDFPDDGLKIGDPGTVVHVYKDGRLEVEFVDREGLTVGLRTVEVSDVREATEADKTTRPIGRRERFYGSSKASASR